MIHTSTQGLPPSAFEVGQPVTLGVGGPQVGRIAEVDGDSIGIAFDDSFKGRGLGRLIEMQVKAVSISVRPNESLDR